MLYENSYYPTYKMLAIDPGLNYVGISIYTLDQSHVILNIEAFTLRVEQLFDSSGLDADAYSERTIKLEKIYKALEDILDYTNPIIVAYEHPFINFRRPMAYGALLEVVNNIKRCVTWHNPNILVSGVEPLLVKKTVGASLTSVKLDVKEALKNIKSIASKVDLSFNHLDEHAVDAIAVGYTYLKHHVEGFVC